VKKSTTSAMALMAAVVILGVVFFVLPGLEGPARKVDARAALHVERARRLLQQFDFGLEYKVALLGRLSEADVDVELEDAEGLADAAADEYQRIHSENWERFQPTDWSAEPPRTLRASYGNVAGQIATGVEGRDGLLAANGELLEDALAEVNQALAVSVGDASGRAHAEANRLKAVVLFHQGLSDRLRAGIVRQVAEPQRARLVALLSQAAERSANEALVSTSGVEAHIADLRGRLSTAEQGRRVQERRQSELDATIRSFEERIAAAELTRQAARDEMFRLQAQGLDLADPRASEAFRDALLEQDRRYREADREAQLLRVGSFPKAELLPAGDVLQGRFVEDGQTSTLTVSPGLDHFLGERAVLIASMESTSEAITGLSADLERLQQMRETFVQRQEQAVHRAGQILEEVKAVCGEMEGIDEEADELEEAALELFDQSAAAAQQASQAVGLWIREAQGRTQDLTPAAKDRSAYTVRQDDGWMGGFCTAQVAHARLAQAHVYFARYAARSRYAALLARATEVLELPDVDASAEKGRSEEAREAGVARLSDAISQLEKAHRDTGRHWTLVAQEAAALQLIASFDHEDVRDQAIAAYRSALKGRENEPYAAPFLAVLSRLENP